MLSNLDVAAAGSGRIACDLQRKMRWCLLQHSRRVTRNQRPEQARNGQKFEYHVSRSPIHTASPADTLPDYCGGFFDRNDDFYRNAGPSMESESAKFRDEEMLPLRIVHPKHAVLGRSVLAKR